MSGLFGAHIILDLFGPIGFVWGHPLEPFIHYDGVLKLDIVTLLYEVVVDNSLAAGTDGGF